MCVVGEIRVEETAVILALLNFGVINAVTLVMISVYLSDIHQ